MIYVADSKDKGKHVHIRYWNEYKSRLVLMVDKSALPLTKFGNFIRMILCTKKI
jgi:hypothetical protein